MPTIKRYPNRKLYDTAAKQYVSLEGIAAMIRRGDEVRVVDHATGEDLTTLTLTQIIVEQEKQQSGFLPSPVLTGLIRSGGNTLAHLRRSLSVPLDLFRQVDDEIERRLQQLVGLGEMAEGEAQRLLEKLTPRANAPMRRPATPNWNRSCMSGRCPHGRTCGPCRRCSTSFRPKWMRWRKRRPRRSAVTIPE